jgi:hypothetical protein
LAKNEDLRSKIYLDLALEGVRTRPLDFFSLGLQRVIASANLSEFKEDRFTPEFYPERLTHHYERGARDARKGKANSFLYAFGLPEKGELVPYADFQREISPAPQAWTARTVVAWVAWLERVSDFVTLPNDRDEMQRSIWKSRITPLGVWLLAGVVLALLPPHTRTLGVWSLAAMGFLLSFFLISQPNPRYFAPAWPVLIVLLAVPADVLARLVTGVFRRRKTPAVP